jgi:hypothetical protein
MANITIKTTDTNAFETFEISTEQYSLYKANKLSKAEQKKLFANVLEQITTEQLVALKIEAEETTMTLTQNFEIVIMLALADHYNEFDCAIA